MYCTHRKHTKDQYFRCTLHILYIQCIASDFFAFLTQRVKLNKFLTKNVAFFTRTIPFGSLCACTIYVYVYVAFHLLLDLTYFYGCWAQTIYFSGISPELLMAILRNVREPGSLCAVRVCIMFKVHEHK